mmetsp:Transcript_15259/g.18868  ORF Transcript_15259/g.18868 Transcript_15259/m.18868 type:complete len:211 (+) Transcript_15259:1304-1936(+)
MPSLCAVFAILDALSYPMYGFNAVTSIKLLLSSSSILALLGRIPATQRSAKLSAASPINRAESKTFAAMTGLKTFSSKCPWHPPTVTATWLPITWAQTIVKASHWVGFTFPGIILDPGSLAGSSSSPRPLRGPEPRKRISFAILFKLTATVFKAPLSSTNESCAANDSNLFGAVSKGSFNSFAIRWAISTSYPRIVLRPVPTAVPPRAKR